MDDEARRQEMRELREMHARAWSAHGTQPLPMSAIAVIEDRMRRLLASGLSPSVVPIRRPRGTLRPDTYRPHMQYCQRAARREFGVTRRADFYAVEAVWYLFKDRNDCTLYTLAAIVGISSGSVNYYRSIVDPATVVRLAEDLRGAIERGEVR